MNRISSIAFKNNFLSYFFLNIKEMIQVKSRNFWNLVLFLSSLILQFSNIFANLMEKEKDSCLYLLELLKTKNELIIIDGSPTSTFPRSYFSPLRNLKVSRFTLLDALQRIKRNKAKDEKFHTVYAISTISEKQLEDYQYLVLELGNISPRENIIAEICVLLSSGEISSQQRKMLREKGVDEFRVFTKSESNFYQNPRSLKQLSNELEQKISHIFRSMNKEQQRLEADIQDVVNSTSKRIKFANLHKHNKQKALKNVVKFIWAQAQDRLSESFSNNDFEILQNLKRLLKLLIKHEIPVYCLKSQIQKRTVLKTDSRLLDIYPQLQKINFLEEKQIILNKINQIIKNLNACFPSSKKFRIKDYLIAYFQRLIGLRQDQQNTTSNFSAETIQKIKEIIKEMDFSVLKKMESQKKEYTSIKYLPEQKKIRIYGLTVHISGEIEKIKDTLFQHIKTIEVIGLKEIIFEKHFTKNINLVLMSPKITSIISPLRIDLSGKNGRDGVQQMNNGQHGTDSGDLHLYGQLIPNLSVILNGGDGGNGYIGSYYVAGGREGKRGSKGKLFMNEQSGSLKINLQNQDGRDGTSYYQGERHHRVLHRILSSSQPVYSCSTDLINLAPPKKLTRYSDILMEEQMHKEVYKKVFADIAKQLGFFANPYSQKMFE